MKKLRLNLLKWYAEHRRDLPWRRSRDPYCIWISEVMLQQTQVNTVVPYYHRFTERFPDMVSLAKARQAEVLKLWEGLGYYPRARNLHRAAGVIIKQHDGVIPNDYSTLRRLPGIGDSTAAAIASIAFRQPVVVLDGNVRRVIARWIYLRSVPGSKRGEQALRQAAERHLDRSDPGTWNQAVMELGAVLCRPLNPQCGSCPVPEFCEAFGRNATAEVPQRRKRKPSPHYHVTAGLIRDGDRLLIAQRKEKGLLGGLWEFPGGKQEEGESLQACLQRELAEELAISVEIGEKVCEIKHAYTHFRITLHVFLCRYLSGPPRALGCQQWRWVRSRELADYAFPRADLAVIEKLQQGEFGKD